MPKDDLLSCESGTALMLAGSEGGKKLVPAHDANEGKRLTIALEPEMSHVPKDGLLAWIADSCEIQGHWPHLPVSLLAESSNDLRWREARAGASSASEG